MPSTVAATRRGVTRSQGHAVTRVAGRRIAASNGRAPSPAVDVALLKRVAKLHNLIEEAWQRIVRVLGRIPTLTEVGIFGVMQSEH